MARIAGACGENVDRWDRTLTLSYTEEPLQAPN